MIVKVSQNSSDSRLLKTAKDFLKSLKTFFFFLFVPLHDSSSGLEKGRSIKMI